MNQALLIKKPVDGPINLTWKSSRRFYTAKLYIDMLGDAVIESCWGGLFNKLGGKATLAVDSIEDGVAVLEQLHKERLARAYVLIT